VAAVGANARWDHAGEPFWDGEVEECINGRLVTTGSYFGVDMDGVIDRLLDQQMSDGGWNCERENGSVRGSFHTTINVLEGLLAAQTAHEGVQDITAARHAGEEFLLERRLFRRQTTGEPADPDFLPIGSSPRWEYDVLRGLHYCRAAALQRRRRPDPRAEETLDDILSRWLDDGRWRADRRPRGRVWLHADEPSQPSPWITLKALRVLATADVN
jgi:hypothetical protein